MAGTSKRLTGGPALQLLSLLAEAIGLNSAIVLQQIHYRCLQDRTVWARLPITRSGKSRNAKSWSDEFPWWSGDTIKRAFAELRRLGLIHEDDGQGHDRTKGCRVDYLALRKLLPDAQIAPMDEGTPPADSPNASGQSAGVSNGGGEELQEGGEKRARKPDDIERARRRRNNAALRDAMKGGAGP